MVALAEIALFLMLAIVPTTWEVVLWKGEEVFCKQEATTRNTMQCITFATDGTQTVEDGLTITEVVAKLGL